MRAVLLLTLSAALANAAVVEHWWNITYVDNANPSGLQPRRVIGVNGTWPPPPVTATQGDTLLIHAFNGLGDVGTALHSHGIFFNQSSFYDGAVGVTQCAIPPGQGLTYNIPTDRQSGTYWIHGHYKGQYVDGLRTPFVIHPLIKEAYQYDEDYTVVLGDWYHDEQPTLLKQFINKYNPTGAEPVPNAPVLYTYPGNAFPSDSPNGASIMDGSVVGNNATIHFEKGKTYRLRFINTAALAMFYFGIDGHQMQVIELDGVDTEPYNATMVPISVAQRVSVLVTARNDTDAEKQDFALLANMNPDMFDSIPDDLQMNITARVTYLAASSTSQNELQPVTIFDPAYPNFEEMDVVPIEKEAMAPANVDYRLDAYFDTFDDGTNRASFNNITYIPPTIPSILTALSMPANDSFLTTTTTTTFSRIYGAQTHAIALNHMDNVQVTIYNWDAGLHPFHLHGHKFQLVQKNYDASSGIPMVEGQANPARRDTVMIPPGGSVSLRFRADNPGVWLLHCHIEWHLESGLANIFIEAPAQAQAFPMPQVMLDQCKSQGIATSGNVIGTTSTTDFKGQSWGPFPQTHITGWTPRAIGALAGSIIAALIGIISIVWYSSGALSEEETEAIVRRKFEEKLRKKEEAGAGASSGGVLGRAKGVFTRQR